MSLAGLLRLKTSGLLKLTAEFDEPSGLLRLKISGLLNLTAELMSLLGYFV